jgi:TnpA family transposase
MARQCQSSVRNRGELARVAGSKMHQGKVSDTAGFTDHVFAPMHLLCFRFAPRIRNLSDTKLYGPPGKSR